MNTEYTDILPKDHSKMFTLRNAFEDLHMNAQYFSLLESVMQKFKGEPSPPSIFPTQTTLKKCIIFLVSPL